MTDPIQRIEDALRRLGAEHEPPAGWEARVLAATRPARRTPWWWFAAPVVAAIAALVFFLTPVKPQALRLTLNTEKGPIVVRGSSPQLGDIVHATASGGDGSHREIWVYHNETELVMACPASARCKQSDDAMTADIALQLVGVYQIVALTSRSQLHRPTGRFDTDVADAQKLGAQVEINSFTVR